MGSESLFKAATQDTCPILSPGLWHQSGKCFKRRRKERRGCRRYFSPNKKETPRLGYGNRCGGFFGTRCTFEVARRKVGLRWDERWRTMFWNPQWGSYRPLLLWQACPTARRWGSLLLQRRFFRLSDSGPPPRSSNLGLCCYFSLFLSPHSARSSKNVPKSLHTHISCLAKHSYVTDWGKVVRSSEMERKLDASLNCPFVFAKDVVLLKILIYPRKSLHSGVSLSLVAKDAECSTLKCLFRR